MNRTDRLLSILLELKESYWQRATDLADLFDVSTRTIYRDMDALEKAGVPVVGLPGKGYSLYEGYLLPPLEFSNDEAVMLLLGSDYLAQNFDAQYQSAAQAAGKKIASVLPDELRETVSMLQESIRFVPVNAFDNPAEQTALQRLRRALMEQRAVQFLDPSATPPEQILHPYGLVRQGDAWYLVAHCRRRQRVHHFRLDQLAQLQLLEETYERPAGYRLNPGMLVEERDLEVKVHFDQDVAHWVKDHPIFFAEDVETRADGLLVTLRVRREAEVIPWLLGWGAHAHVLKPASLQRRLAREAEKIAAHYRAAPSLLP